MGVFLDVIAYALELFVVVLFAYAILSWFPVETGTPLARVVRVFAAIAEPVLRPIRRLIPPIRVGSASIDLSVLVVMVFCIVVAGVLRS